MRARRQQWCSVKGALLEAAQQWQGCAPGLGWQHQLEQVSLAQEGVGASHRALQEGWRDLELQGILVVEGQDPALGPVEPPACPGTG